MVNGSRYYRALESVSIASTLSSALTIYPCQIRVHQRWQFKLQIPTSRKKEWRPATAAVHPRRLPVNTVIHTTLVGLEPTTFRLLVRRATSSATDSATLYTCTHKTCLISRPTPRLLSFALRLEWINGIYITTLSFARLCHRQRLPGCSHLPGA